MPPKSEYPTETHLSPNLTWEEMRCNCGAPIPENLKKNVIAFAKVWQKVRDKYGKPMTINSGIRCPKCNRAAGGALHSQHLYGLAADNHNGWSVTEAIAIAKVALTIPEIRGISVYESGFCHLDIRTGPRWYSVNGLPSEEARLRRWTVAGKVVK